MGHYFASPIRMIVGLVLLAIAFESVHSTITVQIGSSGGLSSAGRRPGRYYCYWDCDLVGCQFEFDYDDDDDDECAYDCRKVCRPRYDFAAKARSSSSEKAETILPPSGEKVAPEVEGGKWSCMAAR